MARGKRKKKILFWQKAGKAGLTVAEGLLEVLGDMFELLPDPFETSYSYAGWLSGWPEEYPRHRLRQEIERMKKREWIVEAEKDGKRFLRLTDKGRVHALCQKIKNLPAPHKLAWDKKWRLAIFDIPEQGKHERNLIRRTLISAGFQKMQKSVYLYPHSIPEELRLLLQKKGLNKFIRFIEDAHLEDDREFRQRFKLKK